MVYGDVLWLLEIIIWFDLWYLMLFFFFFQAEDGIRDRNVTGVQTCALPILTFCRSNLCSFEINAWISAAMARVSSTRDCASHTRTSSVSKKGWSRMSHQIFLALSMQPVFTSRLQ